MWEFIKGIFSSLVASGIWEKLFKKKNDYSTSININKTENNITYFKFDNLKLNQSPNQDINIEEINKEIAFQNFKTLLTNFFTLGLAFFFAFMFLRMTLVLSSLEQINYTSNFHSYKSKLLGEFCLNSTQFNYFFYILIFASFWPLIKGTLIISKYLSKKLPERKTQTNFQKISIYIPIFMLLLSYLCCFIGYILTTTPLTQILNFIILGTLICSLFLLQTIL